MSQSAKAFNTTMYATKLSSSVEEALKSDHWRKAMEKEISALRRKTKHNKLFV